MTNDREDVADKGDSKPVTAEHCAFCGRHRDDVRALIQGPEQAICDRCVAEFRGKMGAEKPAN